MVEEKYLKAVENLEQIERNENLSDFELEVDGFFNYLLSIFKEDFKEWTGYIRGIIQEVSGNSSPYDSIVLIHKVEEMYVTGPGRKRFCKVAEKVTDIYNSIGKINGCSLTITNYTNEEYAEFDYELSK